MIFLRLKLRGIINYVIMSKNNGKVYYAVGRGHEIGIYNTWQECKAQIDGFNQAIFRKFFSLEEAKKFVNFWKDYSVTQKQPSTSFVSKISNYKKKASNKRVKQNCSWKLENNYRRMHSPPRLYKTKTCFFLGCENSKVKNNDSNNFNAFHSPYVSPFENFSKARLFKDSNVTSEKKQINSIENNSLMLREYSNEISVEKEPVEKKEVVLLSPQKSSINLVNQINSDNSSVDLSANSTKPNKCVMLEVDLAPPSPVNCHETVSDQLSNTQISNNKKDSTFNKQILNKVTKQLCDSIQLLNSLCKCIKKESENELENVEKSLKIWMESMKTNDCVNLQIDCEENGNFNVNDLTPELHDQSQEQGMQDFSFLQLDQSSSVCQNHKSPPSSLQISGSQLEPKSVDVLALSLRLDSFEKRFDACLKEIGAISSQISQIKSEITEIKEQVSSTINASVNYSPEKSKELTQTTINISQPNVSTKEVSKLWSLKRKLSEENLTNSKRFNPDADLFDSFKIKLEAVNYTSFTMDADEYVHVYTDGACNSNGKKEAKAGIGVWFGDCHPLNIAESVEGCPTNNSAEIQAARIAVTIAYKAGIKKLKIFTDSEFLINCATKWIKRWKKNGWQLVKGGPVKNRAELEKLDEVASKIDVQWVKVEGHAGIYGNEMADRLAKEGAAKYKR